MFEKETDSVMHLIRRSTIGDGGAIGLREIFESGIPSNVKTFFKAEVQWTLAEERKKNSPSSKFPYHLPDIQMLQEQIDHLLIHNFVFSGQDFETTLDRCVHFLFNYLCRPQWTLASFLFEPEPTAPASVINRRLLYCRDYPYFIDILRRHVGEKQIEVLTQEETSALLHKIDREVTRNHSPHELAEMTRPMYDFIAYARSEESDVPEKSVPTRALMYFFDDKRMTSISERLAHERDVENNKEIRFSKLVALISESMPIPQTEDSGHKLDGPLSGESGGIEEVHSGEDVYHPMTNHPKPFAPIFSIEEERAIVKIVFDKDEEKFQATVKEILSSPTWGDASLALDHYFTMHDVEPFSKEAVLFTNLLQNRFNEQISPR